MLFYQRALTLLSTPSSEKNSSLRLHVNLQAIVENVDYLKTITTSEIAPVLKADAYGVGVVEVSKFLFTNCVYKKVFVATLPEGISLRTLFTDLGYTPEIYVLEGLCSNADNARQCITYSLSPVLNSLEDIRIWNKSSASDVLKVAIQFNLGMNRLGINASSITDVLDQLPHPSIVLGHLSSAFSPSISQKELKLFKELVSFFPTAQKSLSASGGIFLGKEYHFDIVRPGAALFGPIVASAGPWSKLNNVCSLSAQLIQIRRIPSNQTVGYDGIWQSEDETLIGTLGIGYADGISNLWRNHINFQHLDKSYPAVGKISMDSCTINLKNSPLTVGTRLELFSDDFIPAELGEKLGISMQEILTFSGTSPRIIRVYSK